MLGCAMCNCPRDKNWVHDGSIRVKTKPEVELQQRFFEDFEKAL